MKSVAKMASAVHETVNCGAEIKETSARVVFVCFFLVSFLCFLFVFYLFSFCFAFAFVLKSLVQIFLRVLCPKGWAPENFVCF